MSRGRLIVISAIGLALPAVAGLAIRNRSSDGVQQLGSASTSSLATRIVEAGAVTVKIRPRRIDATGAEFEVDLDTHSTSLDMDVAKSAELNVGGTEWVGASWSGDEPGGHHRSGTLRFPAAGPVEGELVIQIAGLSTPVTAAWMTDAR